MKRIFSIFSTLAVALAMLVAAPEASAQTDAQFSQYYQVKNYYNPGAIGTGDLINIRGGGRMQWVGIDNAPKTFIGLAESPFKFLNRRFGAGVLLQSESMGLYKNLTIGAQLGIKLKLLKGELTIGVQPGFISQSFKGTEVFIPDDDDYHQTNDDAIPNTDINGNAFDLAVGLYYTRGMWWGGVSATHVTAPTISLKSDTGSTSSTDRDYEFNIDRTYYLMAGCNIPVKNTLFEVMPSVLAKTDLTTWTAEADIRLRYNKFLTAGVGYRWKDALAATIAAEFKGIFIGYAYDYPMSDIVKASSGSHEIFAGYSLKLDFSEKNKNKHKSIRIL